MANKRLNAICPYFAMFPLDYPAAVIANSGAKRILDPFCGRGTTNMAARLAGIPSVGIDCSPVAHAITEAKMANTSPEAILRELDRILEKNEPEDIPEGEFWGMMYNSEVLSGICTVRESLLDDCTTPERKALRGIVLGALHGPLRVDGTTSYLSNQFPRTYASKPNYSVRFWKSRGLTAPPAVSLKSIVAWRADRYYSGPDACRDSFALCADSTSEKTFDAISDRMGRKRFDTVITSPPYMGMCSYVQDQWLRNWFMGGPAGIDYSKGKQISSLCPDIFIENLRSAWKNCAGLCSKDASLNIRFGRVGSREEDPREIIAESLEDTGWTDIEISDAGEPRKGFRQCDTFQTNPSKYCEIDVRAVLTS